MVAAAVFSVASSDCTVEAHPGFHIYVWDKGTVATVRTDALTLLAAAMFQLISVLLVVFFYCDSVCYQVIVLGWNGTFRVLQEFQGFHFIVLISGGTFWNIRNCCCIWNLSLSTFLEFARFIKFGYHPIDSRMADAESLGYVTGAFPLGIFGLYRLDELFLGHRLRVFEVVHFAGRARAGELQEVRQLLDAHHKHVVLSYLVIALRIFSCLM